MVTAVFVTTTDHLICQEEMASSLRNRALPTLAIAIAFWIITAVFLPLAIVQSPLPSSVVTTMKPCPDEDAVIWPVSREVNNPAKDYPAVIQPVE